MLSIISIPTISQFMDPIHVVVFYGDHLKKIVFYEIIFWLGSVERVESQRELKLANRPNIDGFFGLCKQMHCLDEKWYFFFKVGLYNINLNLLFYQFGGHLQTKFHLYLKKLRLTPSWPIFGYELALEPKSRVNTTP